jgi:hypothetical protein
MKLLHQTITMWEHGACLLNVTEWMADWRKGKGELGKLHLNATGESVSNGGSLRRGKNLEGDLRNWGMSRQHGGQPGAVGGPPPWETLVLSTPSLTFQDSFIPLTMGILFHTLSSDTLHLLFRFLRGKSTLIFL